MIYELKRKSLEEGFILLGKILNEFILFEYMHTIELLNITLVAKQSLEK